MADLTGQIDTLPAFQGYDPLWYWIKGHVDKKEFQVEVERAFDHQIPLAEVHHAHARNVPTLSTDYDFAVFLSKPGRGAYPITYFELQ